MMVLIQWASEYFSVCSVGSVWYLPDTEPQQYEQ